MLTALRESISLRVRSLLGDQLFGIIDYARFPDRATAWGGPFNGQLFRQELFRELVRQLKPAAIVETGTYLGTTTEFIAKTGLPIFSIEAHPRRYGFARVRLWRWRNVRLLHDDSRAALLDLFAGPLKQYGNRTVFFYLDAHWNDDLPLAEELEIVFTHCPAAVAMVDDFRVPGDGDYDYDNYGMGKALTDDYISDIVGKRGLVAHYPSTPARMESGGRRGCVILSDAVVHGTELSSIPLLRAGSMPAAH
jgi:hypothetical protein